MQSSGYYRTVAEKGISEELISWTVLEGAQTGEKALVSGEQLIWSEEGGFCEAHARKILPQKATGIYKIDGVRVFAEQLTRGRKLVVCGGGHVAIAIIRLAKMLDYQVTVLEDRPLFAGNAREAGADCVICDTFEAGLAQIPGDGGTCFVIVTRGHRYDEDCLASILRKRSAYVGMMGSHRRTAIVRQDMLERGLPGEAVKAVHAPIGLSIGAETPEEIAVSIMAEIIAVQHEGGRLGGIPDGILERLNLQEEQEQMAEAAVLATIVSRKGSAPRAEGTKMLMLADGSCIDTIGGGCVEAEVVRRARMMLAEDTEKNVLMPVSLTADAAEEEGMVCGGTLEVFMEKVAAK